jgi:cellulose synthase/poly-beta-1,6-N-acetylglucosamine synthase-like glycosyltransferase
MDSFSPMAVAFWIALAVVVYVYFGYPALLAVWARIAPRPIRAGAETPPISVIVAARNEGAVLRRRIDNLLASDYPSSALQIIVVSDGSTDETASILASYAPAVDAILLPPGGKATALNAGVAAARHDVVVFADARQTFAPGALRALVAPLSDPRVGGVSGELLLDCEAGQTDSTVGGGVGAYWRYEKWLRRHESLVGSTLGATGAIYALRRELWRPLPGDTILDDVLAPMRAVLAGARVVFEGAAHAFDRVSPGASVEFRRKTRTLAGNFQLLRLEPRLLVPLVNPVWLQFVSHKLGRLVVPYALCVILIASAVLAGQHVFYACIFILQLAFYGLAAYGAVLERRGRGVPARPALMSDAERSSWQM